MYTKDSMVLISVNASGSKHLDPNEVQMEHPHVESIGAMDLRVIGQVLAEDTVLAGSHSPPSQLGPARPSSHRPQSGPVNGGGQTHLPLTHRPLLAQLPGQPVAPQPGPAKPASQTHLPPTHVPRPPQSFGHVLSEQSGPAKPRSQAHSPPTQRPLSVQFPGQLDWPQSAPWKPGKQTHVPPEQRPWWLHSLGHSSPSPSPRMEQPEPAAGGQETAGQATAGQETGMVTPRDAGLLSSA